jgi:hypothetical protein
MKKKPEEPWVLVWTQQHSQFNVIPLSVWIQAMQQGYVQGRHSAPPCIMLGLVKTKKEAEDLSYRLAQARSDHDQTMKDLVTTAA